ncbi:MAG: FliH/SctL family protein [Thermodesulfobacteriota bacterium]
MRQKIGTKRKTDFSFERLEAVLQGDPGDSRMTGKGPGDDKYDARKEAGEIIRQAREKAVFIEHEAYEKGYAQGEKDGFEFGKEKLMVELQNFIRIMREINDLKSLLYKKWEEEILTLTLAIARKIIHHEVTTSPELIRCAIKEALNYVVENSKVRIRAHPYDFAFVDEIKEDFLKGIAGLKHVEIVEDKNITQGGCLLETEFGDIDVTLDGQLAAVEIAIEKVLKAGKGIDA